MSSGQVVQYTNNGIVFSVNVPADTASSGSGPIYIQMAAPSGTEWLGLGQGTGMAGANMLLMYSSSSSNVTISPRLGQGEFEPDYNPSAQITLLEGSGITSQGQMVANIRCDSCISWSGGSLDPTDTSSDWIYSIKEGSSVDSSDLSENLPQHDTFGTFNLDLTKGTGGSSSNPFVAASSSSSPSSGGESSSPAANTASATESGSSPSPTSVSGPVTVPSGVSSGGTSSGTFSTPVDTTRAAHAAIMSAVFVVFFPLFALTLYLPTTKRVRYIHAPLQVISIILMLVGLGLGVKLGHSVEKLDGYHQIIGYILVAVLLGFQPAFGLYQHLYFHRTGGRSALGPVHQWLGRIAIIVGMVNGGLGFMQSGSVGSSYVPNYAVVLYSIVAVVVLFIYLTVVLSSKWRAARQNHEGEKITGAYEMHASSRDQDRPYISGPQYYQGPRQQNYR